MNNWYEKIKRYNFWEKNKPTTGYIRTEYIDKLLPFIGNKLIKVIVGQRRSGKSYILRQIINHLINNGVKAENTFYLNKEYLAFDEITDYKELDQLIKDYITKFKPEGKIYIFLDEIQNIEGWERLVNSYAQDFTQDFELYITGSNSELLAGELATLLSGRYIEFLVQPLSIYEYADVKRQEITRELFFEYLRYGGLPETLTLDDEESQRHYIEGLKNTIILRDIIERKKIKDVVLLNEIFNFLVSNIGSLTSYSSIVQYFKAKQKKTNYETLSAYVGYLNQAFIFNETQRYKLTGKQVLGGERKFYLNDLSFSTYLQGFNPNNIAKYLENFVYLHLKRLGYQIYVGNHHNLEIDFVCTKHNITLYIQVAYLLVEESTINREFGNLLKIKDNYPKYVVSLDEFKLDNYKGIEHIRPWELNNL